MSSDCPSAADWEALLAGGLPGPLAHHLDGCPACQATVDRLTADFDLAARLQRPEPCLPPAYRRALGVLRPELGGTREMACIHVERMPHRNSIAVPGESAAAYLLLKLVPTGLAGRRPGLNLALAVDVSGSMYEEDGTGVSRLQRVQTAALGALSKLGPDDTLAVVAFAHSAQLVLPPTPLAEKGRIEDVVRRIDQFAVDPGGTAMDEGLALALAAVEPHRGAGKLSQIVLLTDGETSGEGHCRTLAKQAAAKQVRLALIGVGLDWKASLIKEMAQLGGGKWYYVDVDQADEAARVFDAEFGALASTAFLDVRVRVRPTKDVRIKRLRQVAPEIRDVPLETDDDRACVASLGALPQGAAARFLLDVSVPRRPDGKYAIAHLELSFDRGDGRREPAGEVPLELTYTAAGAGYVNAEVMRHIDDVQLKEMSDLLRASLEANDTEQARQVAEEMVKKGEQGGDRSRKKTMIARSVLDELNVGRKPPKKTQLALEDQARLADPPV